MSCRSHQCHHLTALLLLLHLRLRLRACRECHRHRPLPWSCPSPSPGRSLRLRHSSDGRPDPPKRRNRRAHHPLKSLLLLLISFLYISSPQVFRTTAPFIRLPNSTFVRFIACGEKSRYQLFHVSGLSIFYTKRTCIACGFWTIPFARFWSRRCCFIIGLLFI